MIRIKKTKNLKSYCIDVRSAYICPFFIKNINHIFLIDKPIITLFKIIYFTTFKKLA